MKKLVSLFLACLIVFSAPLMVLAEDSIPTEQPETAKVIQFIEEKGQDEAPWMWKRWKYGVPQAIDNWVVFVKTLMGMGLSPQATSAVAGNVEAESGFDSGLLESGLSYEEVASIGDRGLGYFQWTDHGRKGAFLRFAKENGKPWQDREVQLAYFWEETLKDDNTQGSWWATKHTSYQDVYSQYRHTPYESKEEFMNETDIERATIIFARNWERPNAYLAHFDRRLGVANESFKLIQMFIDTTNLKNSESVKLVNKYRTDASVEELQLAEGVKMHQDSVLVQVMSDTLTEEERFVGSQIKKGISLNTNNRDLTVVSRYVSLLGWLAFGWGFVALIVWVMAYNDSLIAQKVIKILLFNKGTSKLSGLWACLGLLGVGLFVLSGLFFKVLLNILG